MYRLIPKEYNTPKREVRSTIPPCEVEAIVKANEQNRTLMCPKEPSYKG